MSSRRRGKYPSPRRQSCVRDTKKPENIIRLEGQKPKQRQLTAREGGGEFRGLEGIFLMLRGEQ